MTAGRVPLKRRSTFNGLHGVIFKKTELFITISVRTSNPSPYTVQVSKSRWMRWMGHATCIEVRNPYKIPGKSKGKMPMWRNMCRQADITMDLMEIRYKGVEYIQIAWDEVL
jgi:hypothetical protein